MADAGQDAEPTRDPKLLEKVTNLCKRRGFIFQSSEIYGGFGSTYDYGPYGSLMLRNVKDAWWHDMVQMRPDVVGLDAAILMAPQVWEASGHVASFTDPLVDCRQCKERFRQDLLPESGACPNCGAKESMTDARQFNLMFKTFVGPVEDDASAAYLRPETAQGIFVNFKNVQTTARLKPPFGIAQVGKAFRNEITPQRFVFRTREFEQMELEYFVPPDEGAKWWSYWCEERLRWYVDLGVRAEHLRLREHDAEELSHYSAGTADVEYLYPWGWGELEGVANRTDYDLTQHQESSGEDLTYFDQESDTRYIPHVIEPSAGATRAMMAFLMDAYAEEEVRGEKRTVLHLDPRLAPIKVAVLPLSKNEQLVPAAGEVAGLLRPHFQIEEDVSGSIGRRYRREDEIGTPFCVTVDFDSLEDRAVTVRDRDSMDQDRVAIDKLVDYLRERLPL
ncbi:MAG TPA: glycine--tRNA ligase [Acidimicrobiia bacterium]|nr:glycine--tRNA ligase [Acidimicrobiia bacterium]